MMNSSTALASGDGQRRLLVSSRETESKKRLPSGSGYVFKPSDEELVKHYLLPKSMGPQSDSTILSCIGNAMTASEFFALPPYDHVAANPNKVAEWYVLIRKDEKSYENEEDDRLTVTRRVENGAGFWKSIKSCDEMVYDYHSDIPLGYKSQFNYYDSASTSPGKCVPKTDWILDEFRLCNPPYPPKGQEWVMGRLSRERESSEDDEQTTSGSGQSMASTGESMASTGESMLSTGRSF
ncbi:NAC domain-containing protein 68 [Linum grandiflorum]